MQSQKEDKEYKSGIKEIELASEKHIPTLETNTGFESSKNIRLVSPFR